jgi:Zn-dependent M28 family amino/carboxypeptidase
MISAGEKVKMIVDLAVEWQDADPMGYNTIAEIPGTDLKDEVVMLGGHMDSWHSGTGATDNAAGVSVAMEAVRIIQTLGLKPRRTIRIALWTGEEQGLLGSKAYVAQHFGKFEPPAGVTAPASGGPAPGSKLVTTPEYQKFAGYFNLDNGTGKVRGVYLQGNEAVRSIFRQWLMPFRDRPDDKQPWGATTLSIANTMGTDHLSFDGIGLPGFQFIQDEIEYDTRTHHSNQDVFDRIQADDMKQAATIMATFVYNTAVRDEKLPRKPTPTP